MTYCITNNSQTSGLYDSRHEHDACGVGFVAHIKGRACHAIIQQGLKILENLDHRGAVGADVLMGDGAGILLQIPDALYREEMQRQGVSLPPAGEYGVGMVFLPKEHGSRQACIQELERTVRLEGQVVLGWREVPVNHEVPLSPLVRATAPIILQIFIGRGHDIMTTDALERKLYVIRQSTGHAIRALALQHGREYFVPSMSARTVVYKGQLLADQVGAYYRDLQDHRTVSALAMVHQRFSTNTFPSWQLAHPYRMIAHNGEINTIKGNVNWMNAREGGVASAVLGHDLRKLWPLTYPGQSDSASFDNCLELLVMAGYPLAQAVMMMIPEAWEKHPLMDDHRRAFYEYHAAMMEPWDGPAAMIFTDGKQIGATLDRNGLRPARFYITQDDLVVMASEAGVLPFSQNKIVKKGRLRPGKMFLLDMEQGRLIEDKVLKDNLANAKPYKVWIEGVRIKLDQIIRKDPGAPLSAALPINNSTLLQRQKNFAYSAEDISYLRCFAGEKEQPIDASMSADATHLHDMQLAVLSHKNKLLFDYFRQLFAQVTNPPIDAVRENIVMSLVSFIGPKPNVLDINNINPPMRLEVAQPILDAKDIAKIREITYYTRGKFCTYQLNICYPIAWDKEGIEARLASLCAEAVDAIKSGYNILLLSDRMVDEQHVAIPILLATSAIHQHLVGKGLRTSTGLVVETGAARTVHHFALLAGYGAEAIHPYLALEILADIAGQEQPALPKLPVDKAIARFIEAIGQGLQCVMAQMGISTYMSYTGSQIFEAIGLSPYVVDKYFKGTVSNIGGIDIFDLAKEALLLHRLAFGQETPALCDQVSGKIVETNHCEVYQNSDPDLHPINLRSLFDFKFVAPQALPLDQIEAADDIIQRFVLNVAKKSRKENAANHLAKPLLVRPDRLGLSAAQLAVAQHIQIDMTPGFCHGTSNANKNMGLALSSTSHHDVYSIEDLAQLIYDLKNINANATISIKLMSAAGVGTVAAGVAKAKVDQIVIAAAQNNSDPNSQGFESLRQNMGVSWEIGLAEVQQTLTLNDLRGRVCIQLEGPIKTGRDIVIAALLGAEIFSITNLSKQDDTENFINESTDSYWMAIAEEVRVLMASLHIRHFGDLIGHPEYLDAKIVSDFWKTKHLDFSRIFHQPKPGLDTYTVRRRIEAQQHALEQVLDQQIIVAAEAAIKTQKTFHFKGTLSNAQRAVGTMLAGEVARHYGERGLPDHTINIDLSGTAGQSFGAFLVAGITLNLAGDANDYVAKGLSGGRVILRLPSGFSGAATQNIIAGNTVLYGAISGEAFFNGIAGERFAACNAGAVAVVEGIGDHGCEYMSGGTVVILGGTGRNFAAGMVGGEAYIYDEDELFKYRCDTRTVVMTAVTSAADQHVLRTLIERHLTYTHSEQAKLILANWQRSCEKFVKVKSYIARQ